MKISFEKNDLLSAINIVIKAIPVRTTMPVLECILIEASCDNIKFTANNMELGIESRVKGKVTEPGSIAIDAKLFSEMVRKLPDGEVIIESDSEMLVSITCGDTGFTKISGKSSKEFPYLPSVEKNGYISISQFSLKEAIRQTIFSIASNDVNKMMTGMLFEVNGNEFKITALDGHRISVRKVILKDIYTSQKVVVPGKTLSEIIKILSSEIDDEVLIFFGENHIMFEFDSTVIVSRLIDGEYFRISQMLSADYDVCMKINRNALIDTLERCVILQRENEKRPVIMDLRDDTVFLKMNSSFGSLQEEINVCKEGVDIMIGINPHFLLDALRVIDDEDVEMYMVNSKSPCIIRDRDETYTYLILPVNFKQV